MADFKFLSYDTIYSVNGTTHKELASEACFYKVFASEFYLNNTYKILIYKGLNKAKHNQDNNCFLSKAELYHHISLLKNICKLTFSIKEYIDEDLYPYYELNLKLKNFNIVHRFVLTWIRYAYEFPFNIYILDTYKLKKDPIFKYVNPFNLFNLVSSSCQYGNDNHMLTSLNKFHKILKYNWIRTKMLKLSKKHCREVSEIFNNLQYKAVNARDLIKHSFGEWNEGFEKRKEIYIDNYNKIKNA